MHFIIIAIIRTGTERFTSKLNRLIKYLIQILGVLAMVIAMSSCEDEGYLTSSNAQLEFSADTVVFDTIFTTIGSTTRHLKIYNPYDEKILVSKISLAGGDMSNFRINVNGEAGSEVYEVEIPARDSIYIFVEVTVDPNGQNVPMVVKDSIVFTTNANIQDVKLLAWGQDFVLIRNEVIKTNTWTSEKPYLIYDVAYVDSLETLTLEPGVILYFHDKAGLYVKGTIEALGTYEEPIIFQGDRLESGYQDVPDQWNGVVLFSGSKDNKFVNTSIRNANIGLQVGTIEHDGNASVTLSNVKIENMSYAGIFALKAEIFASNVLVANCGFYATALLVGGSYEFYHTTIANYYGKYANKVRNTASLALSNVLFLQDEDGSTIEYVGDLSKATFKNCIIYGDNYNELELGSNDEYAFNYLFDHCILQIPDTSNISNKDHYVNVWRGADYDPLFVDPYEYIYELDTLSPAMNIGSTEYSELFPFDLNKQSRISDEGPDLGAFERIEGDEEE